MLHAARLQPPLHRLLRCLFAARDLTLRDSFALLVPMRTLSYALRQWFAEKSRYLQQHRCTLPAELIASTAAKTPRPTLPRTAGCERSLQIVGLDNLSYDAAKLHCH